MSSAYSILHNYQQDLYSPNLELMNTALQFKQQTLNANRMKLQTMYDQFTFLDVAKEQDQDYLEGRLQATKTIMDKYTGLDLSSSNLTNQLIANMSDVVDDNVRNAVISTRIYQGEQADWNNLREENPEKYSETNHAYASQVSNAWLNDGQVGSKYNGGGGVIEYIDVHGKMSEHIPDIAENLKAEWVELASGGGYFRDVVTKERVSRDKLEAAMEGLLNEQDRRQLQINAWGAYDGMSDQQLESVYTSHFSPKIEQLENEIASLERTVDSTKDPALKEQRQGLLDFYRDQLTAYEANSFENIVDRYGRAAAYNTLYDNQFRGAYLDTYSYTDRITKIATYDNDVQQRNYQFKLDDLQFRKDKEAFNQALKTAELELKERELDLKAGKTSAQDAQPGDPNYQAPIVGTEAVLDYSEAVSKIEEHQKNNQKIVDDTKALFGIEDDAQLRDLSKIFNEGFAGKEFIEFNGQKINVADNLDLLLDYQNNILSESAVEKAAMTEFNKAIDESLSTLMKLTQGDNPDWIAAESTPKFNFKFEWDEETQTMKKVEINDLQDITGAYEAYMATPESERGTFRERITTLTDVLAPTNYYAHLLGKENLSEEEKFTLDVYHRMHLLMDPELDNEQKNLIFKDLQNNQFSSLSNEDYNSFPNDIHAYNRMSTRRNKSDASGGGASSTVTAVEIDHDLSNLMKEDGLDKKYGDFFFFESEVAPLGGGQVRVKTYDGYEGIMQDITTAYEEYMNASDEAKPRYREKINSLTAILDMDLSTMTTHKNSSFYYTNDYYISDITEGDAEYYDKNGNEVSIKAPSDIITQGMDLYANTLEQEYKGRYLEPSLYPQIFSKETSGYNKLTALVGLPSGSKVPITLERVWDEETKKPTNEVKWSYQTKIDGEMETISSEDEGKRLKVDQLRNNGVIDFADSPGLPYDSSWGADAPVVNLGNNIYDEKIKKDNVTRYGDNLALSVESSKLLLDDARKFGGEELFNEVYNARKAFKDGAYEFKLESVNGVWQYSIYDNTGTRVYSEYTEGDDNPITSYSSQEISGIFRESEFIINTVMYNYLYSKIEDASEEYILRYQEAQEEGLRSGQ